MSERLYPVATVADLLGVSRDTVYRLIEAKELRAVRLTTRAAQIRVPASELDRYQKSLAAA